MIRAVEKSQPGLLVSRKRWNLATAAAPLNSGLGSPCLPYLPDLPYVTCITQGWQRRYEDCSRLLYHCSRCIGNSASRGCKHGRGICRRCPINYTSSTVACKFPPTYLSHVPISRFGRLGSVVKDLPVCFVLAPDLLSVRQ